jgi:hypothetical protein
VLELQGQFTFDSGSVFNPAPVDTSKVQLPTYVVENIRERLAYNIHEVWSKQKIDNGWQWAEVIILFLRS